MREPMKRRARVAAIIVCLGALAQAARAQSSPLGAPGIVQSGGGGVMVGDKPAARSGDAASGGPVVSGSPDVFIAGKPAATAGSAAACGARIATGSSNVFINGKPMARAGDPLGGCPR